METLRDYIKKAVDNKVAIGHFNISDLVGLKAIESIGRELAVPVIIGLSEGEAGFLGYKQAGVLVKILKEEGMPVFLNADHTKSLDNIKEAARAGFDAVLFDAGRLSLEENIKKTKEAVEIAKSINSDVLVEAEIGYLGSSSVILEKIPEGAAIAPEDLTKPEEAKYFAEEAGIDLLAPAIGNIHGMFKNASNPDLDIERIKNISEMTNIPLVLHGGSGIKDEEFLQAIEAGVSIIHINTEIRLAWRKGVEKGLMENPKEIAPYKILPLAIDEMKKVVKARLALFNRLS